MALEKSRHTINQLEHQLSLGDTAFAKKEADLRSSFSRRERELQDAFDELYERNQVSRTLPRISPIVLSCVCSCCTSSCWRTARKISCRLRMRPPPQRTSRQPSRCRSSRIAPSTAAPPQIRLPVHQTLLLKQRLVLRCAHLPPPQQRHRRTKLSPTAATARWSR
jgi:hypothetical protein